MAKRRSTVEKGFLNLLDSGKLPANWKSEYDADLALGCLIASMKDGILPFMVATRFQYRNWLAIDARRDDVVSVSNDSKTVWELLELFLFEKIKRNGETLPFTFDKMITHPKVVPQITNHIADIVEKYGNRWSSPEIFDAMSALVSEYDKKKLGSVSTSLELVREILDQIPAAAFGGTVLDPVCGNGSFLYCAKELMLANGASEEEALNRIAGIDIDPKKVYITNALLNPTGKYKTNLCVGNSLQLETTMKFDVIVGNPPFQQVKDSGERRDPGSNLWTKFIVKSFELLKEKGILAFVTPNAWVTPYKEGVTTGGREAGRKAREIFRKNQVIYLNLDTSKYFPKIGSSFTSFIIEKVPSYQATKVIYSYESVLKEDSINLKDFFWLPATPSKTVLSIIDKVFWRTKNFEILSGCNPIPNNSLEQSDKFCFPYVQAASTIRWSDAPHKHQYTKKVIFPVLSTNELAIYDDGTMGPVTNGINIKVSTDIEGANLLSIIHSKLIQFCLKQSRWHHGYQMTYVIQSIPKLDITKVWSDEDLYQHFSLTEEEIALIEASS